MMMIHAIKAYVMKVCAQPQNAFGPAFFEQHILVVREYSRQLATQLNADQQILELAAYLHDIAAIQDANSIPQHHLVGAEIAADLLAQHHYPAESINAVMQCIRSHSAPLHPDEGSIEEICLSQADAMSQIARPAYWLFIAYRVRQHDFEYGRDWLLRRVERHWEALIPRAKLLIESRYLAARALLQPEVSGVTPSGVGRVV